MINLIRKILKESLEGGKGNKALSEKEIRLFKLINKNKKTAKTKDNLLDLFRTFMPMIGKSKEEALLYYEIYTANYREDGDYENLTKDDFVDYRDFKSRRISNINSSQFVTSKIPFKGSNLEGKWEVDDNNKWYYVVTSYNWYPIYLFKDNQWFRVSNNYSSATSKHLSHARPYRKEYDENVEKEVTLVTPQEIKNIMYGKTFEELKPSRIPYFIENEAPEIIGVPKLKTFGVYGDYVKVRYKLLDAKEVNGKLVLTIEIMKAGKVIMGTNKMETSTEGYIYPSPFSESIERGIKNEFKHTYRTLIDSNNTEFIFRHQNKN